MSPRPAAPGPRSLGRGEGLCPAHRPHLRIGHAGASHSFVKGARVVRRLPPRLLPGLGDMTSDQLQAAFRCGAPDPVTVGPEGSTGSSTRSSMSAWLLTRRWARPSGAVSWCGSGLLAVGGRGRFGGGGPLRRRGVRVVERAAVVGARRPAGTTAPPYETTAREPEVGERRTDHRHDRLAGPPAHGPRGGIRPTVLVDAAAAPPGLRTSGVDQNSEPEPVTRQQLSAASESAR